MNTKNNTVFLKIILILISCISFIIIIFKDAIIVNTSIWLKFLGFTPLIILAIISIVEMLPKMRKFR